MTIDDKYVVFKKEEWDCFWDPNYEQPKDVNFRAPEALSDAVVLRLQDQFAAGALSSYADQVLAFLDLAEHWGADVPGDVADRLLEIADHFRGLAEAARDYTNKLPD